MFIDGQAISTRIERSIKKQSKCIKRCLKERDNVCKILSELGDPTKHVPYTFHDIVSSLLLEQSQGVMEESNPSGISRQFKKQILECYQLKERCNEEIELLENEMVQVIQFYATDVKTLQSIDTDTFSVGEICIVMQESERQKIRLAVLKTKFELYINLEGLVGDELQPCSHIVLDEQPTGYSSSAYDTDESDDED